MFERYTEKARRSIFFARFEASQFGSMYIETHHLLLGLMRENAALFEPWLQKPAAAEELRKYFEERFPARRDVATSVDLPLSHECRRALTFGAEEAGRLRHWHIGPEHLVLGLLRESDSEAAQALRRYGVELESLRSAVAASGEPSDAKGPQPGPPPYNREELHRLADSLDGARVQAAVLVLEALHTDVVAVSVAGPEASFRFSFSGPGSAADWGGSPGPPARG